MPLWLWPNILSIDAPLIAVVWQDFLARCYPSLLLPAGRWALALTVWAVYLTDRLLDARYLIDPSDDPQLSFHLHHFRLFSLMLVVVLTLDAAIVNLWLRRSVLEKGILVFTGVVAYLGVFPVRRFEGQYKTPAAAFLFTAGVFLVAWTGIPRPETVLVWPAAAFAGLCLGNMALIRLAEQARAAQSTGLLLAIFSILCILVGNSRWYHAVAAGGVSLTALAFVGRRFSRNVRRLLADLVLLSPLLFR